MCPTPCSMHHALSRAAESSDAMTETVVDILSRSYSLIYVRANSWLTHHILFTFKTRPWCDGRWAPVTTEVHAMMRHVMMWTVTTVVVYVVICRTTRGHLPDYYGLQRGHLPDYACYSTGLPSWFSTWSFTGPWCKKDRTTVVIYVVICRTTRGHLADFRGPLVIICRTTRHVMHVLDYRGPQRGPLPDLHGHLRGHLPDYAWSSTGLPWSSTLSSTGPPWSSTWSSAGLRVVTYRTSVVLCMVIWKLCGHQLDCFCLTYLELPSVIEIFEIADQCKLRDWNWTNLTVALYWTSETVPSVTHDY